MVNGKRTKLWVINIMSFVLFILLSLTGLVNWLVLPKGYEARGSFLVPVRHIFVEFHQWTALAFMVIVAIHILLHRKYITANLKKHGIVKQHA